MVPDFFSGVPAWVFIVIYLLPGVPVFFAGVFTGWLLGGASGARVGAGVGLVWAVIALWYSDFSGGWDIVVIGMVLSAVTTWCFGDLIRKLLD